jgi:WD40 repeat protein
MSDLSDERDPVDLLAEEFVNRLRSGQRPSVTEYADRCPQRAEDIRDLFPALVEMEQLKPVTADHTGAYLPAAEPSDPLRVGEFRILRRVGFGGMGVVYEAMQESLGRHVALKLLPTEALADVKRLERFRREAKAAARLHHTNIVPVFGTGEADGRHFYAMQFIQKLRPAIPPLVHSARVRHICFNADGSLIATASADGTAGIWDAKTGARRFVLKHDGPLTCVSFHPKDGCIVTAAEDKTVRLWAAADGKQLDWKLPVNTVVNYLAFSPDGSQLLLCNRDRTAQVWSVDAPAPLSPPMPHETPGDVQRFEYNYQKWPRFSPDGKQAVSFMVKDLYLWSANEPQQVRKIADVHASAVLEAYFIPNSNWIFVTGAGPMARAIDLDTGKVELIFNHPRNCNIGGVSPDGKWLITSSSGGLVHVWSAADGKPAGPVLRCGDFCSIVTFSPDSSRYLASSQDGTVRVWALPRRHDRDAFFGRQPARARLHRRQQSSCVRC